MKLGLGTAQFGLEYGTFNHSGQASETEIAAILDFAAAFGVDTLDTARSYGSSEAVLGRLKAPARFRVITKIRSLALAPDKAGEVRKSLLESRFSLGTEVLDTALFHSASDLLGKDGREAWAAADKAMTDGQVRMLGVSVYNYEDALDIASKFPIKIVQLPVNVFDQRAIVSGALDRLKSNGIEVHARSVFLQGFALADLKALPRQLSRFQTQLEAFHAFAAGAGVLPRTAALGFVLAQPAIDRAIVGVETLIELEQVFRSASEGVELNGIEKVASEDMELVNPSTWMSK